MEKNIRPGSVNVNIKGEVKEAEEEKKKIIELQLHFVGKGKYVVVCHTPRGYDFIKVEEDILVILL